MMAATLMGTSQESYISTAQNKRNYIAGTYPSVAANTIGDVVCVYNTLVWSCIYDALGKLIQQRSVDWTSQNYVCKGNYPKVAINDSKQVVMVYNQGSTIKYRTGAISRECVSWRSEEYDICVGKYPSIAMRGDRVVVVFQVNSDIHYCFGSVVGNNATITWTRNDANLRINAAYPSVAMNHDLVVVLYNYGATLLSIVGEFDGNAVVWGEVQDDSRDAEKKKSPSEFSGYYPSVTMFQDEDNTIVSTFHRGAMAGRCLFARCGKVQAFSRRIKWHEATAGTFVHGCYSSLAAVMAGGRGQVFVEMHSTNKVGGSGIYHHVSRVVV